MLALKHLKHRRTRLGKKCTSRPESVLFAAAPSIGLVTFECNCKQIFSFAYTKTYHKVENMVSGQLLQAFTYSHRSALYIWDQYFSTSRRCLKHSRTMHLLTCFFIILRYSFHQSNYKRSSMTWFTWCICTMIGYCHHTWCSCNIQLFTMEAALYLQVNSPISGWMNCC